MQPISTFRARAAVLPVENVDTDQIIPARFLKVTDKNGLGEALFSDWRYRPDGQPNPDFVLNQPGAQGARILVAGDNFGCGSSREHAPWALLGFGFQAIVSTYFADIFRSNSLKNGLLPIVVDQETHAKLLAQLEADPAAELEVDLGERTLRLPDGSAVGFPIEPFARHCLMNGLDQIGFLLAETDAISAFEAADPTHLVTTR
jgi:3-isopropylmalate/(R)-2-methylmalate dehydratase small subunit